MRLTLLTFLIPRLCKKDFINQVFSLEQELTNYACLSKGDTINIHYQGRDFLIDVVECKPVDFICVVEADIEVDFKAPLDYKEAPLVKKDSHFSINEEEKTKKKIQELEQKFVRLDGKALTDK